MNRVIVLILLLIGSDSFACIGSITVLDAEFNKISAVESSMAISKINDVWKNKLVSESKIQIDWSNGFKLDIIGDECGGRWLYHLGGWLIPLSMKEVALYQINEYENFEALLGIAAHSK